MVTITIKLTELAYHSDTVQLEVQECATSLYSLKAFKQLFRAIPGYYSPLSKMVVTSSLGVIIFLTSLL